MRRNYTKLIPPREKEAKALTTEFLAFAKSLWGTPSDPPLIQSAAFEIRYPSGFSIDGWHGHASRGYGILNVVLGIWKSDRPSAPELILKWEYIHNHDVFPLTQEALDDYKKFLSEARKVVLQNANK